MMTTEPTTESNKNTTVAGSEAEVPAQTEVPRHDEVAEETKALIDAIKKRAQAEIHTAGDVTRETYLKAVHRAREAIEQTRLIKPEQIDESIHQIHQEAEKNWHTVSSEIESFGNRLVDAARTAWDKLIHPETDSK
jgi:hypothetical protein